MAKDIIKLNRGDSYDFKVSIPDKEDCTKNYILTGSDVIYFALLCVYLQCLLMYMHQLLMYRYMML